jgi:hypothetical protein
MNSKMRVRSITTIFLIAIILLVPLMLSLPSTQPASAQEAETVTQTETSTETETLLPVETETPTGTLTETETPVPPTEPEVTASLTPSQVPSDTQTATIAPTSSASPTPINIYYVKPTGTGNCNSWANACALQTALGIAVNGSEIWVAAGTYKPTTGTDRNASFQLKNGVAIYGGFSGTETARDQRNPVTNITILSGDLNGNDAGFSNNSENVYHVVRGATGATLDGFTITAGNANGAYPNDTGGGIYNRGNSSPLIKNITISGNWAQSSGGGMENWGWSDPTLMNVTFSGNSAYWSGGGLSNENESGPTLINVTFSGNSARYGGGMLNYECGDIPSLTNVTFSANSASISGGGMSNDTCLNIPARNTIFWGNTAPTDAQISNQISFTGTIILSDSVVQGGCPPKGGICTNIISSDPQLGALGNYGGFTQTFSLMSGSSAIDAGNDTVCPSSDQRGVTRPQGAHCDIGAFEYDSPIATVTAAVTNTPTLTSTNTVTPTVTLTRTTTPTTTSIPPHIYYVTVSGSGNCGSWGNACTLQTALSKAISGDEIWVAAGTHKPTTGTDRAATFQLKTGVAIYGGFTGNETTRDQRDPAANQTTLSADLLNNDASFTNNTENVYHVVTGANGAILDGFTITGGNANGSGCPGTACGAGIYNNNSSPSLTNITLSGNSAYLGGAGIYNYSSSPILTNVTINENSAALGNGAGMYNQGSSPKLTNITIIGNSAIMGGGMLNDTSSPILTNVTFTRNTASQSGGAIINGYNSSPQVRNTIFWSNTAVSAGAQIYNIDATGSPVISDSIVQGGYASGTNIITSDPLLGLLDSYGGYTQTIPLLAGSSAIDAGNDSTCDNSDQRGVARPQGAHCDIGAFEYKASNATSTPHPTTVPLGAYHVKPGGTGNCSSWANACDLQIALNNAPSGFEIWVAAGTYKPTTGTNRNFLFVLKNGVAVYGGFAGTETARDQRDPVANLTILSGDLNNDDVGFANNTENAYHVVAGATGATLDGFRITGGNANGSGCPGQACGAGVYNYASSPKLTNITISGNSAFGGAGIYNNASSPILTNVTISGNSTTQSGGAGMLNTNSSSPKLTNTTFSGNAATMGGGMLNDGSSPILTNVTFSGNSASQSGGGMINGYNSSPQIRNAIFWGNTAGSTGAQIYNYDATGFPAVSDSIIQGGYINGTNILTSDPLLGRFGSYGGYTQTFSLMSGSAAIDAGNDSTCDNRDQRGVTRPQGAHCDIGAFEYDGPIATVTATITNTPTITSTITVTPTITNTATITLTRTSTPTKTVTVTITRTATATNTITSTPSPTSIPLGTYYVKPIAINAGNCTSWANACALQTALSSAVSGDEIWVAAGTYKPTTGTDRNATFQLKTGVAIYGGFAGAETTRDQRDPVTNPTILSGDLNGDDNGAFIIYQENVENVLYVVTGANGATLDGFTIRGGKTSGIYNQSSSPVLTNLIISDNYSVGVYDYTNSSPSLTNVIIRDNYGDGMYNSTNSSPSLTNTTFSHNGAGIYNYSYSSPSLTNVTISDNLSTGVTNYSYSNSTLTHVTIRHNSGFYAGGMYNYYSNPTLTDVTISDNIIGEWGGGMNNQFSNPILTNVTFSGNSAYTGGGMSNNKSNPILTNVTFSGNLADSQAGGIYNSYNSSPTLTNVTFNGNSAVSQGGGMYNFSNSNPQILNTIFWGNSAPSGGAQIYNSDSVPVLNDSIVQDGCPTTSTCTNILTGDPLLGRLGDYGGYTQTNLIMSGSSAIDAGNDTVCPSSDQRGVARPQGAHCDIGAFEFDSPIATVTATVTNTPTLTSTITVTATITNTPTITITRTPTITTTPTITVTRTPTITNTATITLTRTSTITTTPTITITRTPTITNTATITVTRTATATTTSTRTQVPTSIPLGTYYVKPTAGGTGSCDSWTNACALQTALTNSASGSQIWVAAGVYKPTMGTDRNASFQLKSGVAVYGGFAGTETALNQRDSAANATILSGDLNGDDAGFSNNGENVYHVVRGASGATLDGFTITAGNANGVDPNDAGGGIYNFRSSPLIKNITLSGNSAKYAGGGMENWGQSDPTLMNVTFNGNSSDWAGGGLSNENLSGPILINVTFNANSATHSGGGMLNYECGDIPSLTNVTFKANSAGVSGGAMVNDTCNGVQARNIIFWGNTASVDAQISNQDLFTGTITLSDSVVQGGCPPKGGTCTNIITSDPQLGTLGNYGGFTQTIPLLSGSSAIDTANDTFCPSSDQRGVARPQGAHCDIGAFEYIDMTAPMVTAFTLTSPISSYTIPITAFTASDNMRVSAYLITESSATPAAGAPGWTAAAPLTYQVTADGTYTLYPWAKDATGNISAVFASPRTVVVDTTAPDTHIDTQPANLSNSASASFSFSSADTTATFECALENGTFTACSSPMTYTGLSEGSHTFATRARDPLGNTDPSAAVFTWVIDTTAPQTYIGSTPANPSNSANASFSFSSDDATATFECSMESGAFIVCASPQTYSGLTDSSHTFAVRAKDPAGNLDASPESFTWTINTTPLAPILGIPVNSLATNDTTPTFTWGDVANGNIYQLEISNTTNFAKKVQTFAGAPGVLTYTATALPSGIYYWHARALNINSLAGAWSEVRSFSIDLTPPAAPVLSAPANAASVIGTPAFTWLASTTAVKYQFQYDNNANFASPTYTSVELTTLTITPPTIAPGTYSWHARAKDAAGNWSAWSVARTISIQPAVPLAPALTAPVNALATNDTTPTFTWGAVAYGNTYQLEISNIASFAVKLRSFTGAAGILTYTSTALPAGTYYWHARALNVKSTAGPWSAARTFSIDLTPPAAPVLSTPANAASVIGTPAFTWLASATAAKYQFQYDDNANFSSPTYTSVELAGLNFTPPSMAAGIHVWRVRARDAAGNWSAWSAVRTILVTLVPTATWTPTPVTPAVTITPTTTVTPTITATPTLTPTATWTAMPGTPTVTPTPTKTPYGCTDC